MKLLVVFAAFIAFCAGTPVSMIPGDNSNYVEGESRYIWMPDGDGVPHLVDLKDRDIEAMPGSRNGANNEYWLFTRANPTTAQIITDGNEHSIWSSNYNGNRPLKVIVHGWNSNGNSGMNPLITAAFLSVEDCNVIVVDWRRMARRNYFSSAAGVPGVGQFLGNFLEWLIDTAGGNWNNVHLVGFSLGAHVVGNAGRTAGGRPARITGLDPAGPVWGGNSNALTTTDGQYVEAIHTDGGRLGIFQPIATVNFYPNGGRNPQPGCWISTCSHRRAPDLFAASVQYNHFFGNQCDDMDQARNNRCSGAELMMGNSDLPKQGNGLFGLSTGRNWPY